MLRQTEDQASIVVCTTCRFSAEARENVNGQRGGAMLAQLLKQTGAPIDEMPCLFSCSRHCSIHLRAPGKIGYVLGDFQPTNEAAAAIAALFKLYRESEFGSIPYRAWPEGVKGHFIVRVPPAGFVSTI
jgi:predicted metal-binding protein